MTSKKSQDDNGMPDKSVQSALAYAERGWFIIPVDRNTKRPLGGNGVVRHGE